jgi:hypothetical protein
LDDFGIVPRLLGLTVSLFRKLLQERTTRMPAMCKPLKILATPDMRPRIATGISSEVGPELER